MEEKLISRQILASDEVYEAFGNNNLIAIREMTYFFYESIPEGASEQCRRPTCSEYHSYLLAQEEYTYSLRHLCFLNSG